MTVRVDANGNRESALSLPFAAANDEKSMTATIALVDDDRNILQSLSIALQAEGFVTRVYSDGEAALKPLLENPPDLAVFDIKMPRMDGLELLRRLREKSQLPVIFLTSKDDRSEEHTSELQSLMRISYAVFCLKKNRKH